MLRKNPFISARPARALQNIVSKHSSQFRGNAQHDALEFLLWLLDRMHEDLGAASPAQQSRGPAQVGVPAGWPHARARGEAFGAGLRPGTPGCPARHWDGVGPRPAVVWSVRGWKDGGSPGAEQGLGCWDWAVSAGALQPSIPALGDILVLGEEEVQSPPSLLPPAKPAVITARRLCCWRNE